MQFQKGRIRRPGAALGSASGPRPCGRSLSVAPRVRRSGGPGIRATPASPASEGAVRARGCDAGRPRSRHGWSAVSDPERWGGGHCGPIAEPGPLRRAEVRLVGRPGRCHAWGCGDQSVPPSSLSVGRPGSGGGDAGRPAMGRTGPSGLTREVRGWGRWGREAREAESGVRLFAAAAPGGSGPLLPCHSFHGTAGSDGLSRLRSLCQPGQGAMGLHAHPQDTSACTHSPDALTPQC